MIGDKCAVGPLIDRLKDHDISVRYATVNALGKIGDVNAVGPLIDSLKDKDIRCIVAEVLGVLGDTRSVKPLTGIFMAEINPLLFKLIY